MFKLQQKSKLRIAVIGGGVSGIACVWELRDTDHEVHIYDAETQLGGHARSHTIKNNGNVVTVDTGFIALQEDCYRTLPISLLQSSYIIFNALTLWIATFSAFLKALNVITIPSDMSMGFTEENGPMDWGGTSIWNFIGSWSRLFYPWFWRFMFDILRFNFCATDIFAEKANSSRRDNTGKNERLESIGEYLTRKGYSEQFKRYYLIPIVAAVWCMSTANVFKDFPAEVLIHFM